MSRGNIHTGLARSKSSLGLCIALCLMVPPTCGASELYPDLAELPDAPQAQAQAQPQALQITILDGEGALNNIRQRTAREPIVQVQDSNHKPVAGVLILFAVNNGPSGAGATFGGAPTFSAVTGADGRAQAHGLVPNGTQGTFTVTVTASLGAMTAVAVMHQQNVLRAVTENSNPQQNPSTGAAHSGIHLNPLHLIPKNPILKAVVAGGVAAGAVVLAVALTSSNGTQITAGAGSVTHP